MPSPTESTCPTAGDDADEAAGDVADLRLGDDLGHRLALLLARDQRARDQVARVRAASEHGLERGEIADDLIESSRIVRKLVERGRIAACEAGSHRGLGCHGAPNSLGWFGTTRRGRTH
jgi:hypothetical protein